ncbi:DUF692 domain-containing protein [Acidihalobacter ferrooxydans]|uniref:UPF0276 protein BW247_09060 n=1 Tax=Acidihalobacter ferrooxydans TaxID=1765967 RepID=A0A1P8UHA1_9GAMM|nr:DUF692 domain-containing protein [Acidihalobacter ferrooxydans]APZ43223.1 hypothetical protein BW247_09060 [Acidihalobacter ferrooxydans]
MSIPPREAAVECRVRALAGIGLRAAHEQVMLDTRPTIGWLEVHSENYFGTGGRPQNQLQRIAEHYPISLHGIGLGLGNSQPPERAHLRALRQLRDLIHPVRISEHLCWNGHAGRYVPDLLPLPHTAATIAHVSAHIDRVQQYLGQAILIENVSSYVTWADAQMPEWEFLLEVANQSGCGILLDVNNVYVNACNHGFEPMEYLRHIPTYLIGEIHLAGHARREIDGQTLLIDTHDRPVAEDVWALYDALIRRTGPIPTLIERDSQLPPLPELLAEAERAAESMSAGGTIAS